MMAQNMLSRERAVLELPATVKVKVCAEGIVCRGLLRIIYGDTC